MGGYFKQGIGLRFKFSFKFSYIYNFLYTLSVITDTVERVLFLHIFSNYHVG